jgi:zinc/manganese transport system ATP-binding protein
VQICFDNLTLGYNRHPAVHHLRGEVAAGSLLAIVGPNGAGKSTLLKGIAGELRPLQGRIELNGLAAPADRLPDAVRRRSIQLPDRCS